jgi:two-component system response regulator MprA
VASVLIVDDDPHIRASLSRALTEEGYTVREAEDGYAALATVASDLPDVVLLDIMLPGIDGLDVCRRLREESGVPILMLTARGDTSDRVVGLDSGADDYLAKPFALDELLARIRALLRRRDPTAGPRVHRCADLVVDELTREVRRGDRLVSVSPREYQLLLILLHRAGEVVSRAELLKQVWRYPESSNVVAVYIGYLRTKLEAGGEARLIHNVRGHGFVLRPSGT